MIPSIYPFQLAILMQPLLTALVILATAQKTNTEKTFVFPEFDYAESTKNVSHIYYVLLT